MEAANKKIVIARMKAQWSPRVIVVQIKGHLSH